MPGKLMNKPNHRGQKILVVDDEKNYRIVLARLFEGVGYQVLLADSAESAMMLLQDEKVSLLLTDLQMSGMNGLDFCRRVRSEIGDIPTIVFTAGTAGLGYGALSAAGVRACLDKPFDNQVILSMVGEILTSTKLPHPSGFDDTQRPPVNEDVFQKEVETP